MIELLFELDYDGIYSDWVEEADTEDLMLGIIGVQICRFVYDEDLSKVRHFSVLVTCQGKRVLSRDLIRFGRVL